MATEQQIANLREIERVMLGRTDEQVELSIWLLHDDGPTGCGTIACIGGYVAMSTFFQSQGVLQGDKGDPNMFLHDGRINYATREVAAQLFAYPLLFAATTENDYYGQENHEITDRGRALNRIRWAINAAERGEL